MAVVVAIDEFGDLVSSEDEDAVVFVGGDGHGFEKACGDASPCGFGFFNVCDFPDIAIEGAKEGCAIGEKCDIGGTDGTTF